MEEISFYVKVPNAYIKGYADEIFNDYELLTYVFIKRNYMTNDSYVFNMLELTRLLGKLDKKKYKEDMKHFKDSLKKFQEKGTFQFFNDKNLTEQIDITLADNNYLIYATELKEIEDDYTKAYDNDIFKIIQNIGDTKISIYGLIHYYMYLSSFIYEGNTAIPFAYCTNKKVLENIGLCKESKKKYEIYLEQIKLMLFCVLGSVKDKEGNWKTSKTYYCKYNEFGVTNLRHHVEELIKQKNLTILDEGKKKRIDEKRQNTANINYLKDKDKKTEAEIEKLNKLIKRNTELNNKDETEKGKVKPKEDRPKSKGFINGKKAPMVNQEIDYDDFDDWGNLYTVKTLKDKIVDLQAELSEHISINEIMNFIKDKNPNSSNMNELKEVKNLLQKELDVYEGLPY